MRASRRQGVQGFSHRGISITSIQPPAASCVQPCAFWESEAARHASKSTSPMDDRRRMLPPGKPVQPTPSSSSASTVPSPRVLAAIADPETLQALRSMLREEIQFALRQQPWAEQADASQPGAERSPARSRSRRPRPRKHREAAPGDSPGQGDVPAAGDKPSEEDHKVLAESTSSDNGNVESAPGKHEEQVDMSIQQLVNSLAQSQSAPGCAQRVSSSMRPTTVQPGGASHHCEGPQLHQSECLRESLLAASRSTVVSAPKEPSQTCWGIRALHPEGNCRLLWDGFALVFFLFDICVVSFETGFAHPHRPDELHDSVQRREVYSSIFWLIDIIINALTGFLPPSTCVVELSPRSTMRHYIRTGRFFLDLVPTLAQYCEFMFGSFESTAGIFTFMRLCKLSRLVRVVKIHVVRKRIMHLTSKSRSQAVAAGIYVMQIVVMLFVSAHVSACALWYVGRRADANGVEDTWITSGPGGKDLPNADLDEQYSSALFMSTCVLTGVGMGQFTTAATLEQFIITAYTLLAMVILSIIINEVAGIYAKVNEGTAQVQSLLMEASNFMSLYDVPKELQAQVESYLQTVFDHRNTTNFGVSLREWLRDSGDLLEQLNTATFGRCLERHPHLRCLNEKNLALAASLCEMALLPPGELVCRPGVAPTSLILIRSGQMEFTRSILRKQAGMTHREGRASGDGSDDASRNEHVLHCKPWRERSRLTGKDAKSWEKRLPRKTITGDGSQYVLVDTLSNGDMLFHRNLLLPVKVSEDCVCVCRSFCEVITLEFAKFHQLMSLQSPEWLQALRVRAAADEDSKELFRWALCSPDVSPNDVCFPAPLDKGEQVPALSVEMTAAEKKAEKFETALHIAARAGATECIEWLIATMGADPGVEDSNGRTALDVAQAARQQRSVEVLINSGASIESDGAAHANDWKPLKRHRDTQFQVAAKSDAKENVVRALLFRANISLEGWQSADGDDVERRGGIAELLKEMTSGVCSLVHDRDCQELRRLVHIVRIRVTACCTGGRDKVLHMTQDPRWWSDEFSKQRDNVTRLPAKRMRDNLERGLEDLWKKDVGLRPEYVERLFERGAETVYDEVKDSPTFPGLRCVYVVHEVPYWWRGILPNEGSEQAEADKDRQKEKEKLTSIGLPHGGNFSVKQGHGKQQLFVWRPVQHPVNEVAHMRTRLLDSGLDLSAWSGFEGDEGISDLITEMGRGFCQVMEDGDAIVRITQVVRVRVKVIPAQENNGQEVASWTLHEAPRSRVGLGDRAHPQLPSRAICGGRMEQALASLWTDLVKTAASAELEKPGAAAAPKTAVKPAVDLGPRLALFELFKQLERGEPTTFEEMFVAGGGVQEDEPEIPGDGPAPARRYPGLRTIQIVHEVPYCCHCPGGSGGITSSDAVVATAEMSRALVWLPSASTGTSELRGV